MQNESANEPVDPEVAEFFAAKKAREAVTLERQKEVERLANEKKQVESKVPEEYNAILDYLDRWVQQVKAIDPKQAAHLTRSEHSATLTFGIKNVTIQKIFDNNRNDGTNPAIKIEFRIVMHLVERNGGGFEWKCKDSKFSSRFNGDSKHVAGVIFKTLSV